MRFSLPTILLVGLCCSTPVRADDLRAKTQDGRDVILKADGTWSFAKDPKSEATQVPSERSKAMGPVAYKGKNNGFALHLKPGTWNRVAKPSNPVAEVEFIREGGDLYAMVIAERTAVPIDVLKEAALAGMRMADDALRVVKEERRKVNGAETIRLTVEVNARGVPVTFHCDFYSSKAGSIQVMTWTGQNIFEEVKPQLEVFLDGFELLK